MPANTRIGGENFTQIPRLISDQIILKDIPETEGAPDGYGDVAVIINDIVNGGGSYGYAEKIKSIARSCLYSNPRTSGVMASPPTITADGTTLPAGQSNPYLRSTYPDFFRISGGSPFGTANRIRSAIIAATGGNGGTNDGSQCSYSRYAFQADANKISVRVNGSSAPYRFIVNGQYVSLTGTLTASSSTSPSQYISLDFTSVGGRSLRDIIIECTSDQGVIGVYVGPTEKLYQQTGSELRTAALGDSYNYGSSATILADGLDAVMADYLGWKNHMNSGSGGTGWATTGSAYTFLQRIQNGDLALNGGVPDVICLQGSINDKNALAADVTANCLAGLQASRAYAPNAPIFLFGVWNAAAGSGGTLSVSANEAAILAAYNSFNDENCYFIPLNGAYGGTWLSGVGTVSAPTGTGNADAWMFDSAHLGDYGCHAAGRLKALAIYNALVNA